MGLGVEGVGLGLRDDKVSGLGHGAQGFTLPETNMETQKGPYKDYSPFKKGAIWVSMLVWGSVKGVLCFRKQVFQDLHHNSSAMGVAWVRGCRLLSAAPTPCGSYSLK